MEMANRGGQGNGRLHKTLSLASFHVSINISFHVVIFVPAVMDNLIRKYRVLCEY